MLTKDQFMKLLNKRAITKPGAARSMARARRNVTIPGLLHALAEKEKQAIAKASDETVDNELAAALQTIEPITLGPELDRNLYVIDISEETTIDSGSTAGSTPVDVTVDGTETSTDVTVDGTETSTDTPTKKRTRRSSRKTKVGTTSDSDSTESTDQEQ